MRVYYKLARQQGGRAWKALGGSFTSAILLPVFKEAPGRRRVEPNAAMGVMGFLENHRVIFKAGVSCLRKTNLKEITMSTLKKLMVIVAVMLVSASLFAERIEGYASPWAVKGISQVYVNYGYLGHDDYGVYGKDSSSNNHGYLGSDDYGAYGKHSSSGNYGYLGSYYYGAYGYDSSSGNYGYLAHNLYGAYGRSSGNYGYLGSSSNGAYGSSSSGNYGILGSSSYGAYGRYTNGNYAYLGGSTKALGSYAATAASYAAHFSHISGSYMYLGANSYGAFFHGPGSSSATICNSSDIGIGAYGPEDAAYFTGDVTVSGDLYVTGDKDNVIKLDDGTWVTMSATEAPYPEYTISGRTKLSNGTARIEFDEPYPKVISKEIPIKVIVTPEGSYSGIYVKDVSVNGFTAVSDVGDRNATFSWMAIARVKGKEQKTDYGAVTAKMQKLEASQRLLGLPNRNTPMEHEEA